MSGYRTRFSSLKTGEAGIGVHPSELWGVSSGPKTRRRSDKARARRRAKRAAKRADVVFKVYLRKVKS